MAGMGSGKRTLDRSALRALWQREAISSGGRQLRIYDRRYPISDGASLQYDQTEITANPKKVVIALH